MSYLRYICFICCLVCATAGYADDCTRYVDAAFNYSICLPQKWKNTYRDMGQRHILDSKRKGGAEISITASRFGNDEKSEWDGWMNTYMKKIGHGMRSIIETKEIQTGTDAAMKLLLFDYSSRTGRVLQRTMLMKHDNNFLVVECRAPVRAFGKYTDLFNSIMSGVDLSRSLEGESVETLKVAEAKPQKQLAKKKEAERKRREEKKAAAVRTLEKKVEPERKPIISEEVKPSRETMAPEEVKPESKTIKPEEVKPETETRQLEQVKPDTEKVVDPETKKLIEEELKKIQELEQKGIIEKVGE